MSNRNEVNKSIQRIKNIDWNRGYDYTKQDTYKLLIREWLRRMALWGKALGVTNKWPFINVVYEIFGEENILLDPFIDEISSFLWAARVNPFSIYVCVWYLYWSEAKNRREISQFNLPEPCEPIIILFELGGQLRKENRFLDFVMIDIDNWKEYDLLEPFIFLDEEIKP